MILHKGISQKANGNYLFRLSINKQLQPYFNRIEFKKTYDINKYLDLKDILNNVSKIKTQYQSIKDKVYMRALSDTEIQDLVDKFLTNNLNEDYEYRANGSLSGSFFCNIDNTKNKTPIEQTISQLEILLFDCKEQLTDVNSNFMYNIADELLQTINLNFNDIDEQSKKEFIFSLRQTNIAFMEEQIKRTKGISKAVRINKKHIEETKQDTTSSKISIDQAIKNYLDYYKKTHKTTAQTFQEKEKALEYFLQTMNYLHIIYIDDLKRSDIDIFVNIYLRDKPKQSTSYLRELTLIKIIKGIDNEEYEELSKISLNTVNKYYQHVNGFCNYLFDDGLITKKINQVNIGQELSNREEFTKDEIILIGNKLKEQNQLLNELFIVYAYSGLRTNELWQSTIQVDTNTKIVYFDVKGTKTASSIRKVPLHNKLLELNITNEWLNKLKRSYTKHTYLTRKLNELIREAIADNKAKTLYSTRHFFITELLKSGVDKIAIDKIVGHSDKKDLTVNTYGNNAFDLKVLKEAINSLEG